jgi:hypothetical protein
MKQKKEVMGRLSRGDLSIKLSTADSKSTSGMADRKADGQDGCSILGGPKTNLYGPSLSCLLF